MALVEFIKFKIKMKQTLLFAVLISFTSCLSMEYKEYDEKNKLIHYQKWEDYNQSDLDSCKKLQKIRMANTQNHTSLILIQGLGNDTTNVSYSDFHPKD